MFMPDGTSVQIVVEGVRVRAAVRTRPAARSPAAKAHASQRPRTWSGRPRSPVWCQRDAWDAHYIGGFQYLALPNADEQARRMR